MNNGYYDPNRPQGRPPYPPGNNMNYPQQGGYPPPSYYNPNNPMNARMNPGNSNATASLVLGIVSIIFCMTMIISLICSIVGLILGISSRKQSVRAGFPPLGNASGGIVCSVIGLVISLGILFYFIFALYAFGAEFSYYFNNGEGANTAAILFQNMLSL